MSLTAERARELLVYDPESGSLRWRHKRGCKSAGAEAGYHDKNTGYVTVGVDRKLYQAHRVIWLMLHGEWPKNEIDHATRERAHNAADALRDVTSGINKQNIIKVRCDSEIGLKGVRFDKRRGHYMAAIKVDGIRHHLGKFNSAELAHAAYLDAKAQLHPGWYGAQAHLAQIVPTANHLINVSGGRRARADSRCGLVGARQLKGGRWWASLTFQKKRVSLGSHATAEIAHAHYCDAMALLQSMTERRGA